MPMHPIFEAKAAAATPIWFVSSTNGMSTPESIAPAAQTFAKAAGFEAKAGDCLLVPGGQGRTFGVLFGLGSDKDVDPFLPGKLPQLLPAGAYRFANAPRDSRLAALAFALGAYRFSRYREQPEKSVRLALPEGVDAADLSRIVDATTLARDLINTPANDMGPAELEAAARSVAKTFGAKTRSIVGDDLLKQNFPLVHAVGRAAARAPRLVDLVWGNPKHPKVTLAGKGVCFDSGGLDIKPENAMLLMKKDMGGAATALALAQLIMDAKLKVRLRVLIPAVENAVSGSAMRPLDVYPSRKGLHVEIGNTDAEGRLILADAMALADEDEPDLLVDFGTLTGAARAALGPELPPFYTSDEGLASALACHAEAENDPLWRMPLWRRYDSLLDSKVADLSNIGAGPFAGSIICALFLQRFVTRAKSWLHFDIYAWNPSTKPARPEGGELQAARALYALLKERYA